MELWCLSRTSWNRSGSTTLVITSLISEGEALEGQIADAVYYAQDLVESRIADVIRARYFPTVAEYDEDIEDYGDDCGEDSENDEDMEIYGDEDSENDKDIEYHGDAVTDCSEDSENIEYHGDAATDCSEDSENDEDAGCDAQDHLIVSQIADDIQALCVSYWIIDSNHQLSQGLQKVTEVMNHIEKQALQMEESDSVRDKQPSHSRSIGSDKPAAAAEKDHMVLFGNELDQIMDKLTSQQVELQTIPITGMGGIGKTTLAQAVYHNPLIVQYFDVCGWIMISQEFNPREPLSDLLSELEVISNEDNLDYDELGIKLHKHLWGRRYLIIIDDVWSFEAWDVITRFLPDNNQGSRIIVTTRLSNLGDCLASSCNFKMNLLDENDSWTLLKRKVFHQERCPPELEEIGKEIAKRCQGLPLSIVVTGGLLTKCMDQEYWKSIVDNVNPSVNSEVTDHCLEILNASYHHLPVHLKPCLRYFRVFPGNYNINVAQLIYLWVGEGFVKPREGKCLEEVAYKK